MENQTADITKPRCNATRIVSGQVVQIPEETGWSALGERSEGPVALDETKICELVAIGACIDQLFSAKPASWRLRLFFAFRCT